jgi:VWFA-related protein
MRLLWTAVLAISFTAGIQLAAAQIPTFSVTSEEVRLNVLVASNGKPVMGLHAADFEVLDNGVRQKIEFASFEQIPISATMVLDLSGSVTGEMLDNLKGAGIALLKGLRKDERAALITFSNNVRLGSPLTTDLDQIRAALDKAKPQPFSNSSAINASYAGLMLAQSKAENPLLIVFSDGLDTLSWLTEDEALESAKQTNVVVYAVSAGHLRDKTFLQDLTKCTGGSVFEVESTKNLDKVFVGILEEFRRRYLLTYIPKGVSNSGWHKLKVRVKSNPDKIVYRPNYAIDSSGAGEK